MTKILYVEDEPFLAKIVKETLEGEGFDITLVTDGGKAVAVFGRDDFDICLLDVMLPHKDGFEIAKEIRVIDVHVPILFLTAKDTTVDVVKGFHAGGNDYLRKPFSIEELIVRIHNLIQLAHVGGKEKRGESNKIEYRLGKHISYFPQDQIVKTESNMITLSYKECQILSLLCENAGGVTARKDILMKAWGDDSFFNSRNLDVYISKLRGYLQTDPLIKIITLKGVGYRLVLG